jgi:hypothetical protein
MGTHVYVGRADAGCRAQGEIEADWQRWGDRYPPSTAIVVTTIKWPKDITLPGIGGKVSEKDCLFTRQFSTHD